MAATSTPARALDEILIHGPTARGTFFIADKSDNIWDGRLLSPPNHPRHGTHEPRSL